MALDNLWETLKNAANSELRNGIVFLERRAGSQDLTEVNHQYSQLRRDAQDRAVLLAEIIKKQLKVAEAYELSRSCRNMVVFLHIEGRRDLIEWFWAVVALGAIPCISPPFKGTSEDNHSYILGIRDLLNDPLIITSEQLKPSFPNRLVDALHLYTIEELLQLPCNLYRFLDVSGATRNLGDIAVIMLTSGSTGQPKAVPLTHGQILRSVEGKIQLHETSRQDNFLGWTDISHVANLLEIHLHALSLGACQFQVADEEIVTNPLKLLSLVQEHQISYTFAPNFLLTLLLRALETSKHLEIADDWFEHCADLNPTPSLETHGQTKRQQYDRAQFKAGTTEVFNPCIQPQKFNLKFLRALISGGESNVVETCHKLTNILKVYGAPSTFIRPGFGMTETCAGCIYSLNCPQADIDKNLEFASLGKPIPNAKMRVVDNNGENVMDNATGELQLSGGAVFNGYYRNEAATRDSFTKDGWFRTGDVACIDDRGQLHLVGRVKDTVVVNGVSHYPHAIEAALEKACIEGIKPTFTAIFPTRIPGSATETLCVAFVATYAHNDFATRKNALRSISKSIVQYCGIRPYRIIPLPENSLQKSTLGKLSRSAIRSAFEKHDYDRYLVDNVEVIGSAEAIDSVEAIDNVEAMDNGYLPVKKCISITHTESIVLKVANKLFFTGLADIQATSSLFDLGVSSIDLLKFRVALQDALGISFPITTFFSHATIRDLAHTLDELQNYPGYDPIVTLQPNGYKTPIFFIHPGMGEVLIFMNLSRHITDRPVHALRARGFDGEPYFESMAEMISTYHTAIKRVQPSGPYALVGYSFGSILTFEIAKRMQAVGDEVKFLATFDQPPHFKLRARTYDWYECVLSVGFFLGLIPESAAYQQMNSLRLLDHDTVLGYIMDNAPRAKVEELGMTSSRLDNWARLALTMKKVACNYDPEGQVPRMDIFYTSPLIGIVAAKSTEEWREDFIGKWDDFVENPTYHFVSGGHRTMINPPHLLAFQKLFQKVLGERGL